MRLMGGRHSVFIRWLLSYCLVMGILLIVSGFVFFEARSIVVRELDDAKEATLRQAANAIGARLLDIERLDLQAAGNPRLQSFMSQGIPVGLPDHYTLMLLNRDFQIYQGSSPFVLRMFVFFKGSDTVVSNETTAASRLFYENYMAGSVGHYRDWLALMDGYHEHAFVTLADAVVYLQSLPLGDSMPMSATLGIVLDKNWLDDTLDEYAWSTVESIVILDAANQVVASTRHAPTPADLRRYRDGSAAGREGLLPQAGILVTSVRSALAGWRVVSFLPAEGYTRRLAQLQGLSAGGLLICLLVGGALAWYFARRNWDVISEIAKELAAVSGIGIGRANEYDVLRRAVAATVSQKVQSDAERSRFNAAMKQNFVRRLILGRIRGMQEAEEAMSDFGIAPYSPHYAVFVLYPDRAPAVGSEDGGSAARLTTFIMASKVEVCLGGSHRLAATEYNEMIVCVVNFRLVSILRWEQDIGDIVEAARTCLAEEIGFLPSCGVSTLRSGIESIPVCFQEALDAVEHKLVLGPGRVIRYAELAELRPVYQCPIETQERLLNAVRFGNAEEAGRLLESIMDQNFVAARGTVQSLKCFLFDMYNLVLKAVAPLDPEKRQTLSGGELARLSGLLTAHGSVEELRAEVQKVFLSACRAVSDDARTDHRPTQIMEFVRRNYGDVNLGVASVAEHFRLSQSYVSRIFREKTGQFLPDFITKVRVATAKDLIRDPAAPLKQVAAAVGFTSTNALIRAFKKSEGVTPGRYRSFAPP